MYVILSEAKDLKSKDRVKSDRMFEMFRFAQHDRMRWKRFLCQILIYYSLEHKNRHNGEICCACNYLKHTQCNDDRAQHDAVPAEDLEVMAADIAHQEADGSDAHNECNDHTHDQRHELVTCKGETEL